jgi:hypothetical protein
VKAASCRNLSHLGSFRHFGYRKYAFELSLGVEVPFIAFGLIDYRYGKVEIAIAFSRATK